jgi:glyoxylase-like metal-dependent hydrolase (beta-lactamase superfamily II)
MRFDSGLITLKIMPWHTVTHLDEGLFQISEPLGKVEPRIGVETVNTYLVLGNSRAALIDTGLGIGHLATEVARLTDVPCFVLNTHYHWDHIGANHQFEERAIHILEIDLVEREPNLDKVREAMQSDIARSVLPPDFDPAAFQIKTARATHLLEDNQIIDLGGRALRVIHTPGHSPGHVCFLDESNGMLFSGDTAFKGPLFVCFELSDPDQLEMSLKRLTSLANVSVIFPGHNEIITNPRWLSELAANVEAVVEGRVGGRFRDDYIVGIECQFGEYSVWMPVGE